MGVLTVKFCEQQNPQNMNGIAARAFVHLLCRTSSRNEAVDYLKNKAGNTFDKLCDFLIEREDADNFKMIKDLLNSLGKVSDSVELRDTLVRKLKENTNDTFQAHCRSNFPPDLLKELNIPLLMEIQSLQVRQIS